VDGGRLHGGGGVNHGDGRRGAGDVGERGGCDVGRVWCGERGDGDYYCARPI